MPKDHAPPQASVLVDTVAIGMRIGNQLPDGRIVEMTSHVPQTIPAEELDAFLDKVLRASDRQKAHYELPDFEASYAELQTRFAEYKEQHGKLDKERVARLAGLEAEVAALNAQEHDIVKRSQEAWATAGKRTEWHPEGKTARDLTDFQRRSGGKVEELARLQAEYDTEQKTFPINCAAQQRQVDAARTALNMRLALLGKPPVE